MREAINPSDFPRPYFAGEGLSVRNALDTCPTSPNFRAMISVQSTADTIHLNISRAEVSDARLAQLLRGLRLESAVAGNGMTDAEADAIAEEMKAGWWARNRDRFIPPAASAEA